MSFLAIIPENWRLTADQRGLRRYRNADFQAAGEQFTDTSWRAASLYRAGSFEEAAALFGTLATPEAAYNRGNALVFLGRYDEAIESYDLALERRPGWTEAEENRTLATQRRLDPTGGDMGSTMKPDEVVFEPGKKNDGKEIDVSDEEPVEGDALRALWLRNVQTRPADFLRAKFSYQAATGDEEDG